MQLANAYETQETIMRSGGTKMLQEIKSMANI